MKAKMEKEMLKTNEEWKKKLTPEQYRVLREKSTEIPFTGKLVYNKDSGLYACSGCGNPLFSSDTKFDSKTGWPSFFEPISKFAIIEKEDNALFMKRTEIICAKCKGHLGHVFPDGPTPTGLRYCLNSCALDFSKKEKDKKK